MQNRVHCRGMKKNIGTADRIMRAVLGVILLALALFVATVAWVQVVLIIGALFCFFQAVMSWCLWYQIIGKNTCPIDLQ